MISANQQPTTRLLQLSSSRQVNIEEAIALYIEVLEARGDDIVEDKTTLNKAIAINIGIGNHKIRIGKTIL